MALTYSLPLMHSSICSSPSSSSGVLGGASSNEFSAARNVLPIYASSSFSTVGGRKGSSRRGPFGTWRLLQESRGQERRRTSSLGNHEMKEFVTPVSLYYDVPRVNKSVKASLGCGEVPKFWSYGPSKSFRDYARPKGHGAPNNYGISGYSAESGARVTVVEAIEPSTGLVEGGGNTESTEEPALAGGGRLPPIGPGDGSGDGGGAGDGRSDNDPEKRISTSQKLTLAYAALVFVGGLIGFAKSGSSKSLLTGSGAALALLGVYAQLPIRPTTASAVGLVISAVLLGVMYPRFKSSGKFLPAGLVSLVSLVMTGGYVHGIVRASR